MPRNPHEKGTRSTTRAVLTLTETLALAEIVRARYTASGLDCAKFAITLNDTPSERESFRFPINAGHIRSLLEACKIPQNRPPAAVKTLSPRASALAALEEKILSLTSRVEVLEFKAKNCK